MSLRTVLSKAQCDLAEVPMSDGEGEEQKPNVSGPEHLNLQVKSQDGNVVHFKAKITTPFRKLMTAYCDRQSVASESVVFLFEGERLRGEQTPQEVGMEDGDSIDVVIHQVGGM